MTRHLLPLAAGLVLIAAMGCSETETGFRPVGGTAPSPLEEERFVKRLHLDLTGNKPADEDLQAGLERLRTEGNIPEVRAALAEEIMARPEFSQLFVAELDTEAFGGASSEDAYQLFCFVFAGDPECAACEFEGGDGCSCDCPSVNMLEDERAVLRNAATALEEGATSSEIERTYASAYAFQLNGGSSEGIATAMFGTFLGRPPEANEIVNVRALDLGTNIEGMAGLLFHQIGHTYADLVDILFSSEVYRQAAVNRTFSRYLGRLATPAELTHFSEELDHASPDVRPVIIAVVSSREYFEQ